MDELIILQKKNKFLTRQRNFFAGIMGLAVVANFVLILNIAKTREKIIMVPGISRELAIEGECVSASYLEETALLYVSALLDLTPDTIDTKKNIVLKHVSTRSDKNLKSLQAYFANAIESHKKFELSTFFSPKKLKVNSKKLQVLIEGVLSSTFGKRGFEQSDKKYIMSFDYVGGVLKLKEFFELKSNKSAEND